MFMVPGVAGTIIIDIDIDIVIDIVIVIVVGSFIIFIAIVL